VPGPAISEAWCLVQKATASKKLNHRGMKNMNFLLSEEHEMIRKMVRDFAKNEVEPTAAERDEEERFDMDILKRWRTLV
jgi:hypothetical protein